MFAKESHEICARSLPRSLATETSFSSHVCEIASVMAGTDTEENIAALLEDDVASDETPANIASALNTLNNNVSALAASMKTMGATLVELRRPQIQTATAKRDSRAVDLTNETPKRQ